jgi:uncharacterized membrane protein
MRSTVVGVFPSVAAAESALREMLRAGLDREDISVMGRQDLAGQLVDTERREPGGSSAGVGMAAGAAAGGLGGLLVGLGLLTIPGIGPVLAAGPIASAIAGAGLGAVGGALIGAMVDLGIPDDEAQELAEAVRRGGILLAARADDGTIDRVVDIMEDHGALDVAEEVDRWRRSGWSRFDQAGAPYEGREWQAPGRPRSAGERDRPRVVRVYRVDVRRRIA